MSDTSQFPLNLPEPEERSTEEEASSNASKEMVQSDEAPKPADNNHPIWGPVGGRNPDSEGNR